MRRTWNISKSILVHRTARHGSILIYCVVGMTAFLGICSLAVDWGRIQLAKTEMRRSIDAAARAATAYLPSDPTGARNAAISIAAQNTVDGQPLVLTTADIVIGKWNSTTKTIDTSSPTPDAVQITGYRTTSRNGQIPTIFAKVIGMTGVDLVFYGTAQGVGGPGTYGIVGLNYFNMNNATCFTGSYSSTTGVFTTGMSSNEGSIACNSSMNLNGSASVGGTIYYNTSSAPSGAVNYDAKTKMTSSIATPTTPTAGSYTSSNDNANLGLPTSGANVNFSSGSFSVPGGNYVINSFSMTGGNITFTGPATIYMYGNFSISGGTITTYQNKPTNLKIKLCASAGVNLSQSSNLYAVVDAPTSPLNLNGSVSLIGSVMSSGISMGGTGGIYYDTDLGINGGSSNATTSLVR